MVMDNKSSSYSFNWLGRFHLSDRLCLLSWAQDLEKSGKWFIACIVCFFVLQNGGIIEGKAWPVVSVVKIDVVEDVDNNGWAEVAGSFEKLRNCTLHSLEWYWVGEQNDVRVHVKRTAEPIRVAGDQTFNQLMVHMPYWEIEKRSYAIAYHKCHPLWITQTKFYP